MDNEFRVSEEDKDLGLPQMSAEDLARAQVVVDKAEAEKKARLAAANKDFTRGLTSEND